MARFTWKYSLALLACVLAGFAGITAAFFLTGHDVLGATDELCQNYNMLVYYAQTTRAAILSFASGQGFDFPAYMLNMGYGADSIVQVGGTAGDLFNLPALLCPAQYMEYLYVALTFVRMYAAALAFSYYCLRRGNSQPAALIGALCYAFSGYCVFLSALMHPFFLTVAVYFPLVLAGADKVFDGESPCLFVVAMALELAFYVYFAYMVGVALLAYCILKYAFTRKDRSVKDFVVLVSKFVGLIVLAFAVSAVIALPKTLVIASQGRLGITRFIPQLFYPVQYLSMPMDLLGGTLRNKGLFVGAVAVFLVIVFTTCRKRFETRAWAPWLAGTILVASCVLVPAVARVLNGFSYPTNRWMFAAGFCFSYIACITFPVLKNLEKRDWPRIAVATLVYVIAYVACSAYTGAVNTRLAIALALFLVLVGAVRVACTRLSVRSLSLVMAAFSLVSVSTTCFLYCHPAGSNYVDGYVKFGSAYGTVFNKTYAAAMDDIEDDTLFRYNTVKLYGGIRNASLNHGSSAVDYYSSSYYQVVDDLRTELGLCDSSYNIRYVGSQSRLALDLLTGVRYYVSKSGDSWLVPYTFEDTGHVHKKMHVWKSERSLPLALATSKVIERSSYEELSMAEKQEALLKGCVIDGESAGGLAHVDMSTKSQTIAHDISVSSGAIADENGITVFEKGTKAVVSFKGMRDSETYLQLVGLDYEPLSSREIAQLRGNPQGGSTKADFLSIPADSYTIAFSSDGNAASYIFTTNAHHQYGGKHDWIVNTGYSSKPKSEIEITFSRLGRYSIGDLSVVCQPVKPLVKDAEELSKGGAESLSFDGHALTASFDMADEASFAVFTVPYSKGWSATVDGAPAEVLRADTAFMAVKLSGAGAHEVELRYETPGLRIGAALSVAGLIVLAMLAVFGRRRRRSQPRGAHAASTRKA